MISPERRIPELWIAVKLRREGVPRVGVAGVTGRWWPVGVGTRGRWMRVHELERLRHDRVAGADTDRMLLVASAPHV